MVACSPVGRPAAGASQAPAASESPSFQPGDPAAARLVWTRRDPAGALLYRLALDYAGREPLVSVSTPDGEIELRGYAEINALIEGLERIADALDADPAQLDLWPSGLAH